MSSLRDADQQFSRLSCFEDPIPEEGYFLWQADVKLDGGELIAHSWSFREVGLVDGAAGHAGRAGGRCCV